MKKGKQEKVNIEYDVRIPYIEVMAASASQCIFHYNSLKIPSSILNMDSIPNCLFLLTINNYGTGIPVVDEASIKINFARHKVTAMEIKKVMGNFYHHSEKVDNSKKM